MTVVIAVCCFVIALYQFVSFGNLAQREAKHPTVIAVNSAITFFVCFVLVAAGCLLLVVTK